MTRKDYEEIKEKFETFVRVWENKKVHLLDAFIDAETLCYISTVKAYTCGSQHSLFGIKDFISDIPRCDRFHTLICNYYCRLAENEAHQIAHVVCIAARVEEDSDVLHTFEFTAMLSNHWKKMEDGWKISEIRMDILDNGGDFEEFREAWYMEDTKPQTYPGVHYPCICGELDSPWYRIPKAENVWTEEEKIYGSFVRYAFAIDNLIFGELDKATTDDVIANIAPWGAMDKRTWITSLKYHRQRERQWGHPTQIKSIKTEGNTAKMELYRMAGHKQRNHPYVYTRENIDTEHACAFYRIECRKEEECWKISRCNYYLGIVELGKYSE